MTRDAIMKQRIRKLRLVFCIVAGFLAVEVVFGITTGSLTLLADAGHMVADVGGLALLSLQFLIPVSPLPLKEHLDFIDWRYLPFLRMVLY